MISSVVIFGPADAGKSTLIGRLHSQRHPHLAEKTREEIIKSGLPYDPAQKYAYLTDRYKDERGERKDIQGSGNTRYMKYLKIDIHVQSNNIQIILIDTPGAQHVERERYKGTFFGDAGIFVIEFNSAQQSLRQLLARSDQVSEFLAPLMSWVTIKPNAPFCIVLSKADTCADAKVGAATLEEMRSKIPTLLPGNSLVHILPTAIDLKSGSSFNVFSDDHKPSWYDGPSLVEVIERQLIRTRTAPPTAHLMMPIVRAIPPRTGFGRIYEGKVLSGALADGDAVILAPVDADNSETKVTAHVRAIFETGHDTGPQPRIPFARAGDIVGVALNKTSSKFETTRSTVIIGQNQRAYRGTIILVQLPSEPPEDLELLTSVTIVWLGRLIAGRVIGICRQGNQPRYYLEATKEEFVVPGVPSQDAGTSELALGEVYFRGPHKKLISARLCDVGRLLYFDLRDSDLIRYLRQNLAAFGALGFDMHFDAPDRSRVRSGTTGLEMVSRLLKTDEITRRPSREQEKLICPVIERVEL
jgi:translation elongation factor EF-1alpha